MNTNEIKNFWNNNPCGDHQVGGLHKKHDGNYDDFFKSYDEHRYNEHYHLKELLKKISKSKPKILEVGIGQGADAEQLIKNGCDYTGLDLTEEAVKRVSKRLKIDTVHQGSITGSRFSPGTFDAVYSYGVLHHVPDIYSAQFDIWSILKPSGTLTMMVYAKHSFNYWISIFILRRIALIFCYMFNVKKGIIGKHVKNARKTGLFKYLKMENFIHCNTDGPENPYTKVYTLADVKKDFSLFDVIESKKTFMHAPPFKFPFCMRWLDKYFGWHLIITLKPKSLKNHR